MKLGTTIPQDEPARVNGEFNIEKAFGYLADAGIRGCMANFTPDEARWESWTRDMDRASRACGVEILEYNPPFQVEALSRERCAPEAMKFVRLLELAESIGCLEVCAGAAGPDFIYPHPWNRSQECHDLLKETCMIIAAECTRRNLKARLVLEPIYTTLLWSPLALARFVDEIGSPNIQGHMDIVNCLTFDNIFDNAEFTRDAFTILGNRIHSAHIKDAAPIRSWIAGISECQVGEGILDLRPYLDCLNRMPPGFPALIEHVHTMAEIERSYQRTKAILEAMNVPVWR